MHGDKNVHKNVGTFISILIVIWNCLSFYSDVR